MIALSGGLGPIIECIQNSDGYILHSRKSGAIVSSNEIGALIHSGLERADSIELIAADLAKLLNESPRCAAKILDEVVDHWQKSGLFSTKKHPFPDQIAYREPINPGVSFYHLGERRVVLRSEHHVLIHQLNLSLNQYRLTEDDASIRSNDVVLDVIEDDQGYGLFLNGEAVWGRAGIDLTRFHVIRECMDYFCGYDQTSALLHAGAVSKDGNALIIAGGSGSGKTTLTLGLCSTGCQLTSDDHVALHRDGRQVIAFPTASAVKAGTMELPELKKIIETGMEDNASPREGVTYVAHSNCIAPAVPLGVSAVIFPQYQPCAQNKITRISPGESLKQLMETGGRLSRRCTTIEPLVSLLNHIPSYQLSYSSSDYSVQTCLELV